jgi:hypothetical protein
MRSVGKGETTLGLEWYSGAANWPLGHGPGMIGYYVGRAPVWRLGFHETGLGWSLGRVVGVGV